jgi:hypothetical protein
VSFNFPDVINSVRSIHPHWTSDKELDYLATISSKSDIVVEIGSFTGRSSKVLASTCKGTLYCIDPFKVIKEKYKHFEFFRSYPTIFYKNLVHEIIRGKVKLLKGFSNEMVNPLKSHLGDKKIDLLWLDGSHDYEDVKNDILLYKPLVKGYIVGHDFNIPSVNRAVKELLPGYRLPLGRLWSYECA